MKVCIARRGGGIGDILMMSPIIKSLHKEGFLVTAAIDKSIENYVAILLHNPYIDCIIDYKEANKRDYTRFIDLSYAAYSYEQAGFDLSRIEIFSKVAEVTLEKETPDFFLNKEISLEEYDLLHFSAPKKWIGLHFFAAEERRSLSKEKAKTIIRYFLRYTDYNLLLLDSEDYIKIHSERIIKCNKMDIEESAMHFKNCKYIICVDSCWLHVAAAFNIPGLALFGSTKPELRVKHYKNIKSLYSKSNCRGCFYKECDKNYECMKEITARDIIKEVKKDEILL